MTRYQRGASFERRVGERLASEGYDVVRAAGSKGKADLIAVKPGEVLVVQCKWSATGTATRPGPAERAEVARLAALFTGGIPVVARNVGTRMTLERITGDGLDPKGVQPLRTDLVEAER